MSASFFAAMHGRDLLYSAMLGLAGKPVKRREFITLAPAQQPARCRLSRSPSAQREAQMLVRLSIIGAFAAILMLPTTLSAQINPGGAINPGGGLNPGGGINPGAINPGGDITPGGAIDPTPGARFPPGVGFTPGGGFSPGCGFTPSAGC